MIGAARETNEFLSFKKKLEMDRGSDKFDENLFENKGLN